jgi:HPt (histidine-containing phosphotransfer) domain-containing protein
MPLIAARIDRGIADMIDKLLRSIAPKSASPKQAAPLKTPDLSRVIKITHPPEAKPQPDNRFDADDLGDRAEAAVDSLAGQFDYWIRADLARLNEAWDLVRAQGGRAEDYRTLFMTAHNIRGSATSFGYPAISRLCGSLCTLVTNTRPGENDALINLHVDACRAVYASASSDQSSQAVADAVCAALEQRVGGAARG